MPHISVKMLKGRSQEQKNNLANKLAQTLAKELGCSESHITLSIEDYSAQEWQRVFKEEITDNANNIYIDAKYDPKSLL